MPSKTQIANIALAKFREGRITSIESTTDAVAIVMADQFDNALGMVLEEHRWNFAGKRATLTELGSTPSFGWDKQFQLPGDCIRVKDVNGEDAEASSKSFEIEGDVLLINDTTAEITYIYLVTNMNLLKPSFVDALAYKLAALTCSRITGDAQLTIALDRQYDVALAKAQLNDAKANGSRDKNLMNRMMGTSPIINLRGGNSNKWARTWNSIRNWP